ncbi:hypothetical protein FE257_000211 [Aspergillus nanangensis]|uniref:Protein kinase domain-containing protein n=1 Tax=Aspergillus nanangensis TaxID=2582783 RepID=A0AAD4D0Y7_ASPNN|nr:hypothetical protein FE257_000211 [Aspergillus nanangensis]
MTVTQIPWERLIRFVATDGRILHGEPVLPSSDFDLGTTTTETMLQAKVISGSDIYDTTGATKVTDEVVTVEKLLGPLKQEDVPILRCVGLNYMTHIRETGRTPPPTPSIFFKPSTTITDHDCNVVIPKIAQDEQADYEGELCLIIGRDAKDVSEAEALDYVAAFTIGNDISSRKLQIDRTIAGPVPQWGFSKGFDTYAPLGPCLLRSDLVGDEKELRLQTLVDGEVRQDALVSDLVFGCAALVSYLSTGTTLQKGSVIMTGTPGGVGNGMKPPKFLKPGNRMEVKTQACFHDRLNNDPVTEAALHVRLCATPFMPSVTSTCSSSFYICTMSSPFLTIQGDPISEDQVLGSGRSGVVIVRDGLAVKTPLRWLWSSDYDVEMNILSLRREQDVYRRLQSDEDHRSIGIVRSIGFPDDAIQLDHMPNGDLRTYLAKCQWRPSPRRQLTWFRDLARTLSYIHDRRVLVADIASRNFLLDSDLSIKFCDFSEASLLAVDSNMETVDDNGFTAQIDIGYLGAVIYEVVTGTKCEVDLFTYNDSTNGRAHWPKREDLPTTQGVWLDCIIEGCWKGEFRNAHSLLQALNAVHLASPMAESRK